MTETRTIERVHFADKWVEYWFVEGPISKGTADFHECGKAGVFWNLLNDAGLYETVINNGIRGIVGSFELVGPNWELVALSSAAEIT